MVPSFIRLLLAAPILVGSLVLAAQPQPTVRQVAITIDDVPRGGDGGSMALADVRRMTELLLRPFAAEKIPVIGFVNAGRSGALGPGGLRQVLDLWLDSGADLGNHTRFHRDINSVPFEEYAEDVIKGENEIRTALERRGRRLEFFRHPMLHTGATPKAKRALERLLEARHYRVAPVTLDNSDYQYAALYTRPEFRDRVRREYVPYMESVVAFFEQRSVEVVGREFPQVLLLHANQMNADLMPDLLAMLRRRGYTFVSLDRALADPAYKLKDGYVGPSGFSWIHRWSKTIGLPPKGEPDPPAWVQENWATRRYCVCPP